MEQKSGLEKFEPEIKRTDSPSKNQSLFNALIHNDIITEEMYNFLLLLNQSGSQAAACSLPKDYEEEINRLKKNYEQNIAEMKSQCQSTISTYQTEIQALK